eukprot:TRINITY_DN5070_c0_g1_i4.p1 TRINITY_DN5070_c0_g1~~TRINITY_DN5070_c0_g1_i4.p1  ORF type:complete len:904 (-),score=132.59 TRINITY_DN5070_c0_g1_i4:250-2961(-)
MARSLVALLLLAVWAAAAATSEGLCEGSACNALRSDMLIQRQHRMGLQGDLGLQNRSDDAAEGAPTKVPLTDTFVHMSEQFLLEFLREKTNDCGAEAQVGSLEVLTATEEIIDGVKVDMSVKLKGRAPRVQPTYHFIDVDWDVPEVEVDPKWVREGLVPHVELLYENNQPLAWCELLKQSSNALLSELAEAEGHEAVSQYHHMLGALEETEGDAQGRDGEGAGVSAKCKGSDRLPADFNYRAKSESRACFAPESVQNQGSCGSCWAFAAGHVVQSRLCIANKADLKFPSVQQVLSCSDSKYGCQGGHCISAFEEWERAGIIMASDYKYTPGGNKFPWNPRGAMCAWGEKAKPYRISQSYRLAGVTVATMQKELFCNGPFTVAFDVYQNFFRPSPTQVYSRASGKKAGGHAVVNVGWGTLNGVPYWEIMNSWGSRWGDRGFIKFRRGINLCRIESGWGQSAAHVTSSQASWKFQDWSCDQKTGLKKRGIACMSNRNSAVVGDSLCPVSKRRGWAPWPDKSKFPSGSRAAEQRPVAIDKCEPGEVACTSRYCNGKGMASNSTGKCVCKCNIGFAGKRCDTCSVDYKGYPSCREMCTRAADCSGRGKADGVKWRNEFNASLDSCTCVCDKGFTGKKCEKQSACIRANTKPTADGNGHMAYIDRQNVQCASGTLLSQWHLRRANRRRTVYYETTCCAPPGRFGSCSSKSTRAQYLHPYLLSYLDRHPVSCGASEALSQFRLDRNRRRGQRDHRYTFTCCKVPNGLEKCQKKRTPFNVDSNMHYMDRHDVKCAEGQAMTQFRMTSQRSYHRRRSTVRASIGYTCCQMKSAATKTTTRSTASTTTSTTSTITTSTTSMTTLTTSTPAVTTSDSSHGTTSTISQFGRVIIDIPGTNRSLSVNVSVVPKQS